MHLQLSTSGISPSSNLQWFIASQSHPQLVWLSIRTTFSCLVSEVRSVKSKLICCFVFGTHGFWLGCELPHVPWQRCSSIWCGLKPFSSTGIIVGLNLQGWSSSFNDDTHAEKKNIPELIWIIVWETQRDRKIRTFREVMLFFVKSHICFHSIVSFMRTV